MHLLLAVALACAAVVAYLSATDEPVVGSCLIGEIQRRFLSPLPAQEVTSCLSSILNTISVFQWLQLQILFLYWLMRLLDASSNFPLKMFDFTCLKFIYVSVLSTPSALLMADRAPCSCSEVRRGSTVLSRSLITSLMSLRTSRDESSRVDVAAVADQVSNERRTKVMWTLQENYYRAKSCLHSAC